MLEAQDRLDETAIRSFLTALPFVREYQIRIVSVEPGRTTIELPFDQRSPVP